MILVKELLKTLSCLIKSLKKLTEMYEKNCKTEPKIADKGTIILEKDLFANFISLYNKKIKIGDNAKKIGLEQNKINTKKLNKIDLFKEKNLVMYSEYTMNKIIGITP